MFNKAKKLLCVALAITVMSVCAFKADAASTLKVYLLGIVDPNGGDRTSWIPSAASYMSNADNSVVYTYTAFNKTQLLSHLKAANFFVIHTHGNQKALLAVDSSGEDFTLDQSQIEALSSSALSNLKVAFLGACYCGSGGSSASNMVNSIYKKGARCVIGYKLEVKTKANRIMLKSFCEAIGSGYTVANALTYADTRVLAEYGATGNTNSRLVRGDTSATFRSVTVILDSKVGDSEMVLITDDNGEEIGYFNPDYNLSENAANISLSERMAIQKSAYNFDENKYTLIQDVFTEDTGVYSTVYAYMINGIPTGDIIIFMTSSSGEIVSFAHPNEGVFDGVEVTDEMVNLATEQLKAHMEEREIYEYVVDDIRITNDNGEPEFRFSVEYTYEPVDNEEGYKVVDDFYVPLEEIK